MKFKMIMPLLLALLIFIISFSCYIIKKQEKDTTLFPPVDGFTIKIDVPKTDYELLKQKIDHFIQTQENEFLKKIDITSNSKTIFEISYETFQNEDEQVVMLYAKTYIDDLYTCIIKTVHYNEKTNQILLLNDYLIDHNSLQILSDISYHAILEKLSSQNININNDIVKNITTPDITNFENFEFTDDALKLTFIIPQNQDIEITISLSYAQINYLLKDEYKRAISKPHKRDLSQFIGKKLIAFTFDDGPNYTTEILLNGLNQYNAKVTFFVLGNRVNENSDIIKRAYEEGNQIGSHTYNHKNLIKLNSLQIQGEINNANTVIREIIGTEPSVFRPPYGNINNSVKQYINVPIILWNIDPLDWKYKDKEMIKNNIVSNAEDGDIVLVHDIYLSSVEGALLAMEELYNQGFAFVTIEEMMTLKGVDWQQGKNYYKF